MSVSAPLRPPEVTAPAPRTIRRSPGGRRGGTATRTLISDVELGRGRNRVIYYAVLTVATVLFALVFIFPLYWMVSSALKSPVEFAQPSPTYVPNSFHPENYTDAWSQLRIAHYFGNTVVYALGGWLIQLAVDVTAAYALSKLRTMLGKLILGMMLASLMLPAAANAFHIYVLKRFFDQIPDDLLDSASLDGAGRLRVLWSIVLPLSRPVLGVVSIFAIIGIWKDFLWPLLVLQNTDTQTLSVALSRLSNTSQVPPTEMMAGLVIASVPMIIVFLIFQRSIIGGLNAGSMKG